MSKENNIKVVFVEAGSPAVEMDMENTLDAMHELVDGYIEVIYPYDDNTVIICNEEGKINGCALNRAIKDDDGNIVDIIAGNFIVAYAPPEEEDFCSLSDELVSKYMKLFDRPEMFLRGDGQILSFKM